MAIEFKVDLKELKEPELVNLIPVFEYISHNNIELYDFSTIDMNDVDITKESDIERFVLTHIYYITQVK
jgi:UV DNA damage repair endonuclease